MPTKQTLKKFGLSLEEWQNILDKQGGKCPICNKVPSTGRWVTDHEHKKGWIRLPPGQRKLAVRGICCWFCNKNYLARTMTVEKARRVVQYLEEYEKRKSPP